MWDNCWGFKKLRKGTENNPVSKNVDGNGAKQYVYQGVIATAGIGNEHIKKVQIVFVISVQPAHTQMICN